MVGETETETNGGETETSRPNAVVGETETETSGGETETNGGSLSTRQQIEQKISPSYSIAQ